MYIVEHTTTVHLLVLCELKRVLGPVVGGTRSEEPTYGHQAAPHIPHKDAIGHRSIQRLSKEVTLEVELLEEEKCVCVCVCPLPSYRIVLNDPALNRDT